MLGIFVESPNDCTIRTYCKGHSGHVIRWMLNWELFVIAFNRCCKYSLQSIMWIWCCKPENKQTYFQVWMFPLGVVYCISNHTMLATLNMRVFTSVWLNGTFRRKKICVTIFGAIVVCLCRFCIFIKCCFIQKLLTEQNWNFTYTFFQ